MKVRELETFGNFIKKIYRAKFKVESKEIIQEAGKV
ncbi:MAG: hypothetical protein UV33_C0040G0002 [Candidatus Daviesbacteria bacterium GW2011_GWA1_42_6]|nr:MAG: hypothetical protein UV33_C0040G0002 [Candidatus Daviesbacteria bacterium GW2011_GWA1_42_6]